MELSSIKRRDRAIATVPVNLFAWDRSIVGVKESSELQKTGSEFSSASTFLFQNIWQPPSFMSFRWLLFSNDMVIFILMCFQLT